MIIDVLCNWWRRHLVMMLPLRPECQPMRDFEWTGGGPGQVEVCRLLKEWGWVSGRRSG